MLEIAIGLAVVLLVAFSPPLRRGVLSMFGLFAIIGVGGAVFAALVWALYASKPLLVGEALAPVQEMPAPEVADVDPTQTPTADLTSALADEEEQQLKDEQLRLEEEGKRIAGLAAQARVVLEQDRMLAERAASFPLPIGVGGGLGDIVALRIPAWRDKEVAARQTESIRTWLRSIGLSSEETESIVTAKAWGSLYDLWAAENPHLAPPRPQVEESEAAPLVSEPEPSSLVEIEPASIEPQAAPHREVVRRAPPQRRFVRPSPAPKSLPPRRSEPEVGPFGY